MLLTVGGVGFIITAMAKKKEILDVEEKPAKKSVKKPAKKKAKKAAEKPLKVKAVKNLVIVESPAKAKTIVKYLGKEFKVLASYGHVRDLPKYVIGIDIENDFEPSYKTIKDKAKVIKEIQAYATGAETVWLATDPDREGEAIAWHVKEGAEIEDSKTKRIVFHEITKTAVQKAIDLAREIDFDLVNAQQARRVLDRIIGYRMSPILSKKIRKGLSAGRVQSVSLKLICEREREIDAFVPVEYWVISAEVIQVESTVLSMLFAQNDPKNKLEISNEAEASKILELVKKGRFSVKEVNKRDAMRHPKAPFITSTLQQDASRKLGWTSKKTMIVAQQLYEGLDIGGETTGLITYMRTDSVRIADEARDATKKLVLDRYGKEYYPDVPREYGKKKKGANIQDAHEAIRPTDVTLLPKDIESRLTPEQGKLYRLIWERLVASQMESSRVENTQVVIDNSGYLFKVTGQVTLFDGFRRIYLEGKEDDQPTDDDNELPPFETGDELGAGKIESEQKFTSPPRRYSEATLVRTMEENGIGRPSTYAPTISTILDRLYVEREGKLLKPTELGQIVEGQLNQYFPKVMDINFTAEMETQLDEISDGKYVWHEVIETFYKPFMENVDYAAENMEKLNLDKPTDEKCEKCGNDMVIKSGRFGEFIACTNYPECKNTKAILDEVGVDCPECSKPLISRKTRRGKVFYGCSGYPDCKTAFWNKPVAKPCPKCDAKVLFHKKKKDEGMTEYCEAEGCSYSGVIEEDES